jgi:hypothetical protein
MENMQKCFQRFPIILALRQAYFHLKKTDISDVCTNPEQPDGKYETIEQAKDESAYITQVFDVKNLDSGNPITSFDFYTLVAAYHQVFLCFPADIKAATAEEKKAYARKSIIFVSNSKCIYFQFRWAKLISIFHCDE